MEEMNIAQKLIKGSAKIDRMRSEVEQLVRIMIGYLSKMEANLPERRNERDRERPLIRFQHEYEAWVVGRISKTSRPFIALDFFLPDGIRTIYDSEWSNTSISVKFVKRTYAALPRLVESLAEEFPELQKAWAPLLDAAE